MSWSLTTHTWLTFTGDVRNDLYLTLERGDFERGGKSVQKNVEVTVYVIYADGEILKVRRRGRPVLLSGPCGWRAAAQSCSGGAEAVLVVLQDCISLGSGEPNAPEHRSFVLYHTNSPRWSELIKLPIPVDRFRGSHLRFEFRHCSSESASHD